MKSTINKDDIGDMALTNIEKEILITFLGLNLNKTHVETIIRRSITNREQRSFSRDNESVAKQAPNIAARKSRIKKAMPSAEENELLRLEKQQQKFKPYIEDHNTFF